MYVCGAIDGTQFELHPEQEFEDAEQQKPFEEGKWSLTMLVVPIIYQQFTFTLSAMHVS